MATIACPGCGLPRVETEVGAKPCPVCDAPPVSPAAPIGARAKKHEPDPTEGLPADVSELYAPNTPTAPRVSQRPPEGGSRWLVGTATFVLGLLCGIGGVLGVQAIDWSPTVANELEVAAKGNDTSTAGVSHPPLAQIAIAPMPHEGHIKPIVIEPELDTDFQLPVQLPPPGVVVTHTINKPDGIYPIPNMKKGEHVVLKGKVKTLRVHGMDAGAILDASELEASIITVTGKIDNRSMLKLKAPNGTIHITAKVDGKSTVQLDAPNGEVKFMLPTTPNRDGSKIDNGSNVAITARVVELKGDISGNGTKVAVTLTRNALLIVNAVNGQAIVEYKSQGVGWSPPEVRVGTVARTATFRKTE